MPFDMQKACCFARDQAPSCLSRRKTFCKAKPYLQAFNCPVNRKIMYISMIGNSYHSCARGGPAANFPIPVSQGQAPVPALLWPLRLPWNEAGRHRPAPAAQRLQENLLSCSSSRKDHEMEAPQHFRGVWTNAEGKAKKNPLTSYGCGLQTAMDADVLNGAEGRTRTDTGIPTTPSR